MQQSPGAIPSFRLYGETARGALPDTIHIETLKDRSQQYDWRIKPHRHFDLFQLMWLRTSQVGVMLDDFTVETDQPAIVIVPPPTIHGFHFSPQVEGTVTTIPVEHLPAQIVDAGRAGTASLLPHADPMFAYLTQVLCDLEAEYRAARPGRDRMLMGLIAILSLWLERVALAGSDRASARAAQTKAVERAFQFTSLVEQHYKDGWAPRDYAQAMGLSVSQLSRDCNAAFGASPLRIIHKRLIDEANRKLAYTPWPVSQIAEALGFSDVAYFSRFYRKQSGMTPSQYRKAFQSRSRSSP